MTLLKHWGTRKIFGDEKYHYCQTMCNLQLFWVRIFGYCWMICNIKIVSHNKELYVHNELYVYIERSKSQSSPNLTLYSNRLVVNLLAGITATLELSTQGSNLLDQPQWLMIRIRITDYHLRHSFSKTSKTSICPKTTSVVLPVTGLANDASS